MPMDPQQFMGTTQPAIVQEEAVLFPNLEKKYKSIIRVLAFIELFLGLIFMVLGIILAGTIGTVPQVYSPTSLTCVFDGNSQYYYDTTYRLTFGEGLWCGLVIVIAATLGIFSSKKNASRLIINCHMGFSITASVLSAVLFIIAINLMIISLYPITCGIAIVISFCLMAIFSFPCFIMFIVSAAYCCVLTNCCGGQGCCCCATVNHTGNYNQFSDTQGISNPSGFGVAPNYVNSNQQSFPP